MLQTVEPAHPGNQALQMGSMLNALPDPPEASKHHSQTAQIPNLKGPPGLTTQFIATPLQAAQSSRPVPSGNGYWRSPGVAGDRVYFPPSLYYSSDGSTFPFSHPGMLHPSAPVAPRSTPVNRGPTHYNPPQQTMLSTSPRGPPRKPKRSGYAVWVGNLPRSVRVTELKDYFSIGAMHDIESIFLISKSSCAFANYRTEAACHAAVKRFHNTRFFGRTLVCQVRIASASQSLSSSESPESLSTSSAVDSTTSEEPRTPPSPCIVGTSAPEPELSTDKISASIKHTASRVPEKFFILKSLTAQDLDASRVTNTWATQPHNEDALRKAYAEADRVYLIFSTNKSGEYYGYARMVSDITFPSTTAPQDPELPRTDSTPSDSPLTILTPATATAPCGRIVDDSARGTVFWESTYSHDDSDSKLRDSMSSERESNASPTFSIEWMSTRKVPFYRTRGMRNPLNGYKNVKVARDGTELDPLTGRRLLQLFHRLE